MNRFTIDLAADASAVCAMATRLDPYLYQDELYGYAGSSMPRLTVGGLLLRLHRLRRLQAQLAPDQVESLRQAQAALEQARKKWLVHYEQKVRRELDARQDALVWYLDDCDDAPDRCRSAYPVEAEKRTMLHHLLETDAAPEEAHKRQRALDGRLRRHFEAGAFIWPAHVQPAYPADTFWWLYGRPAAAR